MSSIFRKFTVKCLRENRTRTLVTIVGIVLSMSLFTAVIEGAYSGINYMAECIIDSQGAWEGYADGVTAAQADALRADPTIKDTALSGDAGWAPIGSENPDKPYLRIVSVGSDISKMISIKLTGGRMPENSSEIVLPSHLASNGGVQYQIGETVQLECGTRHDTTGRPLTADSVYSESEELTGTVSRTYTVVGICERPEDEAFGCAGYTAYTTDTPAETYRCYFTMKDLSGIYDFSAKAGPEMKVEVHEDMLMVRGVMRDSGLQTLIYGFAGVLLFLISFGSISLIYNSFSISVSERTKLYGILKSVGATKKQIRGSVLYEALILAGIAIPLGMIIGCAGIGITLYCLRDAFRAFIGMGSDASIHLALDPGALLLSAAVCLVTTVISAWIPARRAVRVSAIDSIRQTDDVRISRRDVRVSGLTSRLFGFEGMMAAKNFRRNRKRYRSVVVSLFISVVLFVSASSFSSYLMSSVSTVNSSDSGTDITYTISRKDADIEGIMKLLSSAGGVTDAIYTQSVWNGLRFSDGELSVNWQDIGGAHTGDNETELYMDVLFADDASFRKLCADNGLRAEDYYNADAPAGIIYNHYTYHTEIDGRTRWTSGEILDSKALPANCYAVFQKGVDGYVETDMKEIDGQEVYVYYPEETVRRYWNSGDESVFDDAEYITRPREEMERRVDLTISSAAGTNVLGMGSGTPVLIYPFAMREAVLGEDLMELVTGHTWFGFRTDDHTESFNAMKTALTEAGEGTDRLTDYAASRETRRMIVSIVNVFAYGFIILISLIAATNVFNTISTNVNLRRREFAMLRSIGMGNKGFNRMMNYECLIYGLKGLAWGLPAAVLVTYALYRVVGISIDMGFYIPVSSILIAVGSVFAVVFATMLYASGKVRKDNPIDALKNENI